MRVLLGLTYFTPYKSGLTVYAERLAKGLVARGHEVVVLTSQYDSTLPLEEVQDGVKIVRLPVLMRLSKGVIMPGILKQGKRWIDWAEVVNLHLPQFDAALLAMLAQRLKKPIVATYHCDLDMPKGWFNRLAGGAVNQANHIAAKRAKVIVHNTQDFAYHSPFLAQYLDKVQIIPPPIEVVEPTAVEVEAFRRKFQVEDGQVIIGMAARLAAEKGVEFLVRAMPQVLQAFPRVRILFVGEYQHVIGEEAYRQRMLALIEQLGEHWTFCGLLSEAEKSVFFKSCQVLVLPSTNKTESLGMVQVEALHFGTPIVASDLPGVRQPVLQTGLGRICPVGDASALAEAIIDVLKKFRDKQPTPAYVEAFSTGRVALAYEALMKGLL